MNEQKDLRKRLDKFLEEALKSSKLTQEEWEKLDAEWYAELDKELDEEADRKIREMKENKEKYMIDLDGNIVEYNEQDCEDFEDFDWRAE